MASMKKEAIKICNQVMILILPVIFSGCLSSGDTNSKMMKKNLEEGIYSYDVAFFNKNKIQTVELKDEKGNARVTLVPRYQGRVMTSTADGSKGKSFGWINYRFIESGKVSSQFNPYGGEERLWFGPEGGPFSIFFKKEDGQVFSDWVVPKEIDTEPFELTDKSEMSVGFRKNFSMVNASGIKMEAGVERRVSLLSHEEAENALAVNIDPSLSFVAYESSNTLKNISTIDWTERTGALSVWMLGMFNPSEKGVVFIPFKKGSESELGKVVTDDYFGKVPPERLIIGDGILFFKTDGKYRSKIGISPRRALPFCGSYDPINKVLTLLWYSLPVNPSKYLNSKWGHQDDPFMGDAVNSYNDGPVEDGSIMGPFYEIESSSPAAFLKAGESITHKQRIFHITGDEAKLSMITERLFSLSVADIKKAFN